jgi:hypothetical protein
MHVQGGLSSESRVLGSRVGCVWQARPDSGGAGANRRRRSNRDHRTVRPPIAVRIRFWRRSSARYFYRETSQFGRHKEGNGIESSRHRVMRSWTAAQNRGSTHIYRPTQLIQRIVCRFLILTRITPYQPEPRTAITHFSVTRFVCLRDVRH